MKYKIYKGRHEGKEIDDAIDEVANKVDKDLLGAANGVATLNSSGQISETQIPSGDNAWVSKSYVDGKFVVKDTSKEEQVYGHTANGDATMFDVDTGSAVEDKLGRYVKDTEGSTKPAGTGRILTQEPTQPYQAANKKYVDGMVASQAVEYGIRWVVGQSDPAGERVKRTGGEIVQWDITYTANVGDTINYNPFDNIPLFNPSVVEDAFGNKFARFGKFYVSNETIGNYEYIWVCSVKANENYRVPQAFSDFKTEWDYVDIGIYEASSETVDGTDYLVSKTGQTVLGNKSRTQFYNLAKANNTRSGNDGSKYLITTMSEITEIIQPLFLIMCGTRNSQTIYNGVCNETFAEESKKQTGLTDTIVATSGTASNDGKNSFKVFNIENWYGNVWKNVLDCTIKEYNPYVCNDLANWSDTSTPESSSAFSKVGYTVYQTSGIWAKAMGYDSANPDIQFTTDGGASSSTYFCDYYWVASGTRAVFYGGHLDDGSIGGLFCWGLRFGLGDSSWFIGARLSRRALASGG